MNKKSKINLIAELGWNHMGDMNLAKEMILAAKESGADICKFQAWSEENLKTGPWDEDGRREIYKKAGLNSNQFKELFKFCSSNYIKFSTSIFNIKDFKLFEELDFDLIKIPSHEVYNLELIKEAVKRYKYVLISLGACKWSEVTKIKENFLNIIPMHCVSSYPLEPKMANFPKMQEIKKLFNNFGYSGHYSGIEDALIAIVEGATYIEKHFTIDKNLPGRDNKFALLPEEFKKISDFINIFHEMNINRGLDVQESELDIFKNYRGRWSKN
jgi:sialic acid synthase SpsE